jgi:lactoylglutathione lyase
MLYTERPSRAEHGTLQHICLRVPDTRAAITELAARGYTGAEKLEARVGRNGRRQVNLYDPDGTRVELMEPKPAR